MVIKRDEETSEVRRSSHVLSREEKGKGTLVQARERYVGSGPIPDPLISVSSGSVRGPLSGPIGDMIVQLAETMSNELPKENLGSSPSPPLLVPPTGFVWKFL